MKNIARIIFVLVVLALLPVFFGNRLVTRYAVEAIEKSTGFDVAFEDIHVGILKPVVRIQGLVLSNPPDFPHPEALQVREAYVRYNPLSLFSRDIRLYEVRLDIPRLVMVKPERGDSNIEMLAKAGHKGEKKERNAEADSPGPGKDVPEAGSGGESAAKPGRSVTIGQLEVKFGEMEVRQYRKNDQEPMVLTVPVGLNRSYRNVTNLQETANLLATELVVRSGVGVLNNFEEIRKAITNEKGELDEQFKQQVRELKKLFR